MNKIQIIHLPLIDHYSRIIKSLAEKGRNDYIDFFIKPLSAWSIRIPVESLEELSRLIDEAEIKQTKRLPLLYKMALLRAVEPSQLNLTIPGSLALRFLRGMKADRGTASSQEAIEFVNILNRPFMEYSNREFKLLNRKFADDMAAIDTLEVKKMIEAREYRERLDRELRTESAKTVEDLIKLASSPGSHEFKKAVMRYLLKFSDPSTPDRHYEIDRVFQQISKDSAELKSEIYNSTAVVIYHEILKSIKKHQLSRAVKYIGKYTVLFRGNPDTPNYKEVDSFEKKFFTIIESRNLWESI